MAPDYCSLFFNFSNVVLTGKMCFQTEKASFKLVGRSVARQGSRLRPFVVTLILKMKHKTQGSLVKTVDNVTHRINHYPVDRCSLSKLLKVISYSHDFKYLPQDFKNG